MADDPVVVNKHELAKLLEKSLPTIDRMIEDGMPVLKGGSNGVPYEFDANAVVAWLEEVARKEAELTAEKERQLAQLQLGLTGGVAGDSAPIGLTAKQRIEAMQAEMLADKLARDRGALMPVEEVEAEFEAVFGLLRQRLLSQGSSLQRLAGLSEDQVRHVDQEMRELLRSLSHQITNLQVRARAEAVADAA